jgi:hypothetical protein
VPEICKAFAPLLARHFGPAPPTPAPEAADDAAQVGVAAASAAAPPLSEPTSAALPSIKWSVIFESRSCDGLKLERAAVIDALAALVPKVRRRRRRRQGEEERRTAGVLMRARRSTT